MSEPKIENMTLEDLMGDRFGRYSKSIIQERALPDIRDGLKPVQRRARVSSAIRWVNTIRTATVPFMKHWYE